MPRERYQPKHSAASSKKKTDAAIAKKTQAPAKKQTPNKTQVQKRTQAQKETKVQNKAQVSTEKQSQTRTKYQPKRKTPSKTKNFKLWWKGRTKKQKIILIVVAVLVLILLIVGIFIWSKFNLIGSAKDDKVGEVNEELDLAEMKNVDSLNQVLKTWETNDIEKMSDKNVKNILLVGLDPVSGCTDTMMLASVNTKTNVITLASFYRDSYTYYEGKKGADYHKLNAVKSLGGGIEYTVKTIENDFKIKIDNYALVNYSTFQSVVNALGGVDVYVSKKEAKFLNETWYNWSVSGNPPANQYVEGVNHLDGEMALVFCRIRQLDSDINRTERQRRVITSIMSSMKSASLSQVNNCLNAVLPYLDTDMKNSEILGTASSAVAEGWLKYEIKQTPMPTDNFCKAGWAGSQWIWICDFEGAAQELQQMLYGKTNIELKSDRVSALDFAS